MWRNNVEPVRAQMTIWRVCVACCIPKAKNTHSEYAILIAFPFQQWLYERVSLLRYNVHCVSCEEEEEEEEE